MDLSIVIPARNEEFLGLTIQNILDNIEGNTEVIAVLDGYDVPVPDIPKDERVRILKFDESIGQRAATNRAVELSDAKYIAKTDAHCAFDKGFDVKLMAKMKDNYTMVPVMRNLHAFDWVCPNGHRRYQGPSGVCTVCGEPTKKEIMWIGKTNPQSKSYRFDNTLHFQYFGEYTKRPEYKEMLAKDNLTETMSLQGSFFMCTREKYWELKLCDEDFGSWGQQGVEVACKTWLSGGRVVVNHDTWYAHMFRTQGGDFGFPYKISGNQVSKAREFSRQLFKEGKFEGIHDLQWLIDKFSPVPDWEVSKGVVYYSLLNKDPKLMKKCQESITKNFSGRIITITPEPTEFGDNIKMPKGEKYIDMFNRILLGLEALDTDVVFLCEDDVIYNKSHFEFTPPQKDIYYYNLNWWQVRATDGYAVQYKARRLSNLCANRELLLQHYRKLVKVCKEGGFSRKIGFEPGTHNRPERIDDFKCGDFKSKEPILDIVHQNATKRRWDISEFRKKPKHWRVSQFERTL
jgi:glycosyltransferase involved in cell wall biosynthesis